MSSLKVVFLVVFLVIGPPATLAMIGVKLDGLNLVQNAPEDATLPLETKRVLKIFVRDVPVQCSSDASILYTPAWEFCRAWLYARACDIATVSGVRDNSNLDESVAGCLSLADMARCHANLAVRRLAARLLIRQELDSDAEIKREFYETTDVSR